MNELLERVSEVMPEEWSLHDLTAGNLQNYDWMLQRHGRGFIHHIGLFTPEGDIGLAPLTVLLKQELEKAHTINLAWTVSGGCECVLFQPPILEPSCHVGWQRGDVLDFEVIANAYLALKEKS